MRLLLPMIMFLLCVSSGADESLDANFGQIKKIDLSDERPASPNHALVTMNLNKIKSGQLGQVTLYQFSKRSRIDFDGDLPKGEYALYAAPQCRAASSSWTLLHKFKSTGTHVQTEKSLPKVTVFDAKPGMLNMKDKALILTRTNPALNIDCQIVK